MTKKKTPIDRQALPEMTLDAHRGRWQGPRVPRHPQLIASPRHYERCLALSRAHAAGPAGAIPTLIHISDGKLHDVNVLDILPVEAGAFYVMDRAYLDFARLDAMHQAGAFFVTRAKKNMSARHLYSSPTQRATGAICDQRVMLTGFSSAKSYPEHLRRVRFKDPESGKTLVFLTNHTTLPALVSPTIFIPGGTDP